MKISTLTFILFYFALLLTTAVAAYMAYTVVATAGL